MSWKTDDMSLEDLVRSRMNHVKRSGDDHLMAACPVHKGGQEKTPSFHIHIPTGSFGCFSCGAKGNFKELKFLMGVSDDSVVLKPYTPRGQKAETNDKINPAVLACYRKCPVKLIEEGFEESVLQEHEVGYDGLYNRITFPIRTPEGRLVAISGRSADGSEPRYKVYTHVMLRDAADEKYSSKSKNWLYGAHTLGNRQDVLYVAEGFKACLWLRQAGLHNTVATMGTQVTESQIMALQKLTDRVILVLDMDEFGRLATKKTALKLLGIGMPTESRSYPGKQPDDLTSDQIQHYIVENHTYTTPIHQ